MTRRSARALPLLAMLLGLGPVPARPAGAVGRKPPDIVVIITDDQRWDTLWAMPILQERLARNGVVFENAFVTTPVCCPDRASLLSGGFLPQNTGVLANLLPNGGAAVFNDSDTLATGLQARGYRTALIGKYMNGYMPMAPRVPPGWSVWRASPIAPDDWFAFDMVKGGSSRDASSGVNELVKAYVTDYLADEAVAFIEAAGEEPLFLFFAPLAPHLPATPAPEDREKFRDYAWRGGAYREEDPSGQPGFVGEPGRFQAAALDEIVRQQLRSLQAVDRAVGRILDSLEATGRLAGSLVVFTSDNGFLWGEHGLFGKHIPYEESIRVPLVIAGPGAVPGRRTDLVVTNLDLGRTIAEIAGLPRASDGLDLRPVLAGGALGREDFLIENFNWKRWSGIRTRREKYVEYPDGVTEFYDLQQDPLELKNRHADPAVRRKIRRLAADLAERRGLQPGKRPPDPQANVPYRHRLAAWGKAPHVWTVEQGALPDGLTLERSGLLHGTPRQAGSTPVVIKVESAARATHAGRPQRYFWQMTLEVLPPPER